jgi:antirestriction protein ArdC
MHSDYVKEVAGRIIEQLREGTAPWVRPWKPGERYLPYNPKSGQAYHGINAVWLMSESLHRGYQDPRWMTFKQAQEAGAKVRRGESGTRLEFWKWEGKVVAKDETGQPKRDETGILLYETVRYERPRLFTFYVFNAAQIEGLPALERAATAPEWERHERAEAVINRTGAAIAHGGSKAFYRPSTDSIVVPERQQFLTAEGYYATVLHELGHWTGHASRLNRDLAHPFGSEEYAREELVAEIASMMLGEQLEIGHDPSRHVSYVASWIKVLEKDPLEIFRASAAAEKVVGLLQGREMDLGAERHVAREPQQAPVVAAERVALRVPFDDKEFAKAGGAQWDRRAKCWYAPAGADLSQLERWLPRRTFVVETAHGKENLELELPGLLGTAKQRRWAEKIRDQAIKGFLGGKLANDEAAQAWREDPNREAVLSAVAREIGERKQAAWWIEHKDEKVLGALGVLAIEDALGSLPPDRSAPVARPVFALVDEQGAVVARCETMLEIAQELLSRDPVWPESGATATSQGERVVVLDGEQQRELMEAEVQWLIATATSQRLQTNQEMARGRSGGVEVPSGEPSGPVSPDVTPAATVAPQLGVTQYLVWMPEEPGGLERGEVLPGEHSTLEGAARVLGNRELMGLTARAAVIAVEGGVRRQLGPEEKSELSDCMERLKLEAARTRQEQDAKTKSWYAPEAKKRSRAARRSREDETPQRAGARAKREQNAARGRGLER